MGMHPMGMHPMGMHPMGMQDHDKSFQLVFVKQFSTNSFSSISPVFIF